MPLKKYTVHLLLQFVKTGQTCKLNIVRILQKNYLQIHESEVRMQVYESKLSPSRIILNVNTAQ